MAMVGRVAVCDGQRFEHLTRGHPYLGVPPMGSFAQRLPRRRIRSVARARWGDSISPIETGLVGARSSERRDHSSCFAGAYTVANRRVQARGCLASSSHIRLLCAPQFRFAVGREIAHVTCCHWAWLASEPATASIRWPHAHTGTGMREAGHLDRERANRHGSTGTVRSRPPSRCVTARARGVGETSTSALPFYGFAEKA